MLLTIDDLNLHTAIINDPNTSIAEVYKKYLANPYEGTRTPGVHASEVCSCLRKTYYTMLNVRKGDRPPTDLQARFEIGHAFHEMVQRSLRYAGNTRGDFTFQAEVPTHTTSLGRQHNIQSHCDGIFTWLDADKKPLLRIGLEIKTESHQGFKDLRTPKQQHIDQALVYMACLDLPLMYFAYINKNDGAWKPMEAPWLYVFDHERWRYLLDRIELVTASYLEKRAPKKETGFHCTMCPYQYVCKPKETEESE